MAHNKNGHKDGIHKANSDERRNAIWNITACHSTKNRRFRGTYRLHLQVKDTLETSQLAARICLKTDGIVVAMKTSQKTAFLWPTRSLKGCSASLISDIRSKSYKKP
jgi:hypothetical protein